MTLQYRSTAMGQSAMVTTPHYLASQAALSILKQGGNAVEAMIAAASTIGVVYPHMNGIGGDNFWLIYNAKKGELKAINSSGRSSENTSIDFYKKKGFEKIPSRGPLAANTVPGAIAGWQKAYDYSKEEIGGQLQFNLLLSEAIHYAKDGFPVTPSQSSWTKVNLDPGDQEFRALGRFDEFCRIFLNNGNAYEPGQIMKQSDLADTLENIAQFGADYFYKSDFTANLVKNLKEQGGILTEADFHAHCADFVDPLSVDYRRYQVYNLPPNTQGLASLSILNILENIDLSNVEEGSGEYYHYLVEAIKCAFRDRDDYITDPDFTNIPIDELLSKKRGKLYADQIKSSEKPQALVKLDPKGDTVWMGIVDDEGNAVSFIQSIYHEFGSGIIPKGTGVLLQNRGSFFSLDNNHLNALKPRKRPFHTLNPAMLLHNGKPKLIYGTMGGEGQPQTQAMLVTRIIDYGMNVQQAIEAPRFLYGRTWGAASNTLKLESRITGNAINDLLSKGHEIEILEPFTEVMGHAGAIWIAENEVKYGGADPRGDGIAIGY
ncbi:gamma-glutamyltransferase [Rummeliibacillus sp. TYF005]|uniref:gamma-glutamyltransferase n=1 Tax=Rummeliibacillus sp. TYF005 TaxID=2058214 RepID=UPI000F547704|nr:gamma-glutamyltransferase [Rummeliibacillus sp. TYF005]RPJ97138.1 gamma-glutamyltransferase [Rummeliibacillus sp. TYF005]